MLLSDFNYELPDRLIAAHPLASRSASRLLHYDRSAQKIHDKSFKTISEALLPNDLLIFNDTRVMQARLYGNKLSGGKIECLVTSFQGNIATCMLKGKNLKPGVELVFANQITATIMAEKDIEKTIAFNLPVHEVLALIGEIPIPPYFKRQANAEDNDRYQTIYARQIGAIAAPTAGLHFDEATFTDLANKGINTSYLTLHVGAGTFKPVQTEDISKHHMHSEEFIVPEACVAAINACRANSGRVIAVGTTVMRTLETMYGEHAKATAYQSSSNIFIKPGFNFQCVDALITNFHLPKSTLLMLVSAFMGHDAMHDCYQHAISHNYRFYSYGDAMLIT